MSLAEIPFKIAVPQEKLDALKQKLALTVFPDELEGAKRDYGVPLADIKRLMARWSNGYNWRKQEEQLNEALPQFTRDIHVDGHGTLNVHYVHRKSEVVDAIPLLFVHGWPGSFIEVEKILPLLVSASPDHPSFHVVAISLPGYGFSEAPKKPGFRSPQYAEVANNLMLALGYQQYVTQGGDWGYRVTRGIGQRYGGKNSMAWHTNMPLFVPTALTSSPLQYLKDLLTPYTAAEKHSYECGQLFLKKGFGYNLEHSTQPQTIGYSLADSPVGLLAWIYEKLVNWTDEYPWSDDEVLTWISMYYFSRAGPAASLRIYYELGHLGEELRPGYDNPTIPHGVSYFPQEIRGGRRSWARNSGNVVHESEHHHGGHFAAHEHPEELVKDVRSMFGKGGPAFGVVPGKTGYA